MTDDVRLGVDVGGTFTDVVVATGEAVAVTKVPSTPESPEDGVLGGVDLAAEDQSVPPGDITAITHGTTVATNAVLEGEWADTALLTTEGFRDVLEIARQDRPSLYDLNATQQDPIVPRDRRFEVAGRLDERGKELTELDEESVRSALDEIPKPVESVAVCLLFAFEDDAHERRVRELVETETGLDISLSSEVLPEIREFERSVATALDAALTPVMQEYLGAIESRLTDAGVPADVQVMGSNGGSMAAETARDNPIRTLLSGPAAGVQGAAHVAELAGLDDIVTMDMGGTSCDVSLVRDGKPAISSEVSVGGYPVSLPMVDVHTVGSGGGSIARVDEGGALRVGPDSAGADPGPICYGRGGTRPTVTDAHFLLGRLDPDRFDAEFDTDDREVRKGIEAHLADPLDTSVEEAAAGVLEVANATMERSLRVVSIERGHDPRELGLVAFGGAGPLHAPELAERLDVPRVLVPRAAGALSALGLLASDVVYDFTTSRVRAWRSVDPADVESEFTPFEEQGDARLADEGVPPDDRTFERALDLRYAGQAYDLTVDVGDPFDAEEREAVAERFHAAHERRYGHASPAADLELVGIRLRARGAVAAPDLQVADRGGRVADARRERRDVWFGDGYHETPVYERASLPGGGDIDGPAVIEGSESTVVVPPTFEARLDEYGNLQLEVVR